MNQLRLKRKLKDKQEEVNMQRDRTTDFKKSIKKLQKVYYKDKMKVDKEVEKVSQG